MAKFRPSVRLEQEYVRAIHALLAKEIALSKPDAGDIGLLQVMAKLVERSALFDNAAELLARNFVSRVSAGNRASWREAAQQSSQGRRIYALLQGELADGRGVRVDAIVQQNARLIRSLPLSLAEEASRVAAKAQREGVRSSAVEAILRERIPALAENRIRLLARTEIGKAEFAVTQVRAKSLGLQHFRWRTSEDGRVRPSHRLMDGIICAWDDLPNPEHLAGEKVYGPAYGPGSIFGCRCVSLPLVDLGEAKWPARVYSGGSITRMTRAQFAHAAQRAA